MPEEIAGPYREALTKLQDGRAADARRAPCTACSPSSSARGWRDRFREFDDNPAAAAPASARCTAAVWHDGRDGRGEGAVPGRGRGAARRPEPAARFAGCSGRSCPALEIKPLMAELRDRIPGGAGLPRPRRTNQRAFAKAFAGDDRGAACRGSWRSAPKVMVTEWIDGHAAGGDHPRRAAQEERDLAGQLLAELHFSAPSRAGPAARRPAPRQLHAGAPTAGCACSTSARWPGCPTGCPRRSA